MAVMIPPFLPEGTKNKFERKIFEQLKNAPGTEHWYVFYSLKLANHRSQVEGEIDFVILIPELGILCLELKGAAKLRRENRQWYYGNDTKGHCKGPFEQADNNRRSLMDYLDQVLKQEGSCFPVVYAVMFPLLSKESIQAPYDEAALEWHDWQVLDAVDYERRTPHLIVQQVLEHWRGFAKSKRSGNWLRNNPGQPNKKQVDKIVRTFKRDLAAESDSSVILMAQQQETTFLTSLRTHTIRPLRENRQIIFEGPAGTGKTFIAKTIAQRSANQGGQVLLLSHTQMLVRWLQRALQPYDNVTVCTYTQLMLDILEIGEEEINAQAPNDSFWDGLPERTLDLVTSNHKLTEYYDQIIIDEAQDFFNEDLLLVLDSVLKGGWKEGNWILCGDWERQNIFGDKEETNIAFLEQELGKLPTRYLLEDNCRNCPRIATFLQGIAREEIYHRIERSATESDIIVKFYKDEAQQQVLLKELLPSMKQQGFNEQDIVLLSFRKDKYAAATPLAADPAFSHICPIKEANKPEHLRYASVHSFKGLEARAVIVTDVSELDKKRNLDLLYVAASRARDKLILLVHRKDQDSLLKIREWEPARI